MSETSINESGWDRALPLLIFLAVIAGWYFGYLSIWAAAALVVLGIMFGNPLWKASLRAYLPCHPTLAFPSRLTVEQSSAHGST